MAMLLLLKKVVLVGVITTLLFYRILSTACSQDNNEPTLVSLLTPKLQANSLK